MMPLFRQADSQRLLLRALEIHVRETFASCMPDVIIGLQTRDFFFGPQLAMQLGIGFVPARSKGKLPGPCVAVSYESEYTGTNILQIQEGTIRKGQRILVVDDLVSVGMLKRFILYRRGSAPYPCGLSPFI
jgi:adenine phosphoribosyltransferase